MRYPARPMHPKRLLIVGGVAGGASAAARARRLNEACDILVFDKGPHVSFANCGLPYYVGGVIRDESELLVATPELFRDRFRIDVRPNHEVTAIDTEARTIDVRDLVNDHAFTESYDALVLSPGARAIRPPVPGVDRDGVFVVRTIPDSRRIRAWLDERQAKAAVVVGGGFIGLEMAENLSHRGLTVSIVELADHVLPPVDAEMAVPVEQHLTEHGVHLHVCDAVTAIDEAGERLVVRTREGAAIEADLVILATGVRPHTDLAQRAGLTLGPRGGIQVDPQMRTSAPGVWAVGDAVEIREVMTGVEAILPLAGPANRQGRIAANDIFGRETSFRGVQGTAVCGVFDMTVAVTGANERSLARAGITDYERIYLHPGHHVGYFPGARPIHIKLLFDRADGRVLGAQAVGEEGVARRIDVISMAIQKGGTVFDLEEAELCYAPQFGAAKDPVNLAGMIAANVVRGDLELARWEGVPGTDSYLLDVRTAEEVARGAIEGAKHIPLDELRDRLDELPRDRELWLYCQVGQRAYFATRLLLQHGFRVRNLPGGYTTHCAFASAKR